MNDTHTSVVGPVPGAGDDRREAVTRALAALNAHDAAGFAATFSHDAIVYTPAAPGPLQGREAIEQDTRGWISAMPDMTLELEELLEDGSTNVLRLMFVGTHTGPLSMPAGEVPATGRRVSVPMAVFDRIGEDGLTAEEHRYLDIMGLAQQLGLV